MDIYLMQHGEAVPAEVDPERPLADAGRASVAAVAAHAAARGVTVDRIVHSGKLRAEQTAAILAAELACADVGSVPGLAPNDDVQAAASALADPGQQGSLAVVGHLPFLDRFASLLVAGDAAAHAVAFRNGGLVRLEPSAVEGRFCLAWAVTPEVARG
jgi:phosphohistidine phosphatase